MKTDNTSPNSRLAREVEREREERHKNDEARAGIQADDDFRVKDARDNGSSGKLHRGH
jgi:hypothetical protein